MQPVKRAPRPSRSRLLAGSCLFLVLPLTAIAACGTDEAKDAAISELAVGSWACTPDARGAGELPFTVRIEDDGTFGVALKPGSVPKEAALPKGALSGQWAVEDGDLEWGFDPPVRQDLGKTRVDGFDSLTPESTRFTLTNPGVFGTDGPEEMQDVIVKTHGTDSVTLKVPGGDPWTCNRK